MQATVKLLVKPAVAVVGRPTIASDVAAAGLTVIPESVADSPSAASVTVIDCKPAVFRTTEKVSLPPEAAVKVYAAGTRLGDQCS